eukprot:TRINITY_DN2302_c0_g1_i7.p1 TRINITY_DN2302_c0_g1~~TRINITY_DN2302_c0_g1_i7.p1  ORF type:complete len:1113 (-),score=325.50 TRINITY_DN2302_c0_g1_i7:501-3839(-)
MVFAGKTRASGSGSGGGGGGGVSGFDLDAATLAAIVEDKASEKLQTLGGVAGICSAVKSDGKKGLTLEEKNRRFAERIARYGENKLPPAASKTFLGLVWEALHDKILILLCVAATLSIALGLATSDDKSTSWLEGAAILVAVIIVVLVTALNDYQKERQFRALNEKKDNKEVKCIRNGERCQVNVHDLQVGDVMIVETGDILSADGLYLDGHNVRMDESSATGESDLLRKDDEKPFMLSGTQCQEGNCTMLVVAVGPNSFFGRTMMSLRTEEQMTPLEEKLDVLAEYIGKIGLAAAIFTFVTLSTIFVIRLAVNKEPFNFDSVKSILEYITTAIIIVVVAVPEGLPLSVTIALAYSMLKMLKDNNLVRHLNACETMGSATNICSDKTGTLTENKMTVVRGDVCGASFDRADWSGRGLKDNKECLDLLAVGVAVNSTAYEARQDNGELTFIGNKTETALLGMAKNLEYDYEKLREENSVVKQYSFSSKKKRMSTVIRQPDGKGYRMYVKGASEIVLGLCDRIRVKDDVKELDNEHSGDVQDCIDKYASDALRTIGLAYVDFDQDRDWSEEPEDGLVWLGVVGIKDPVRKEVPAAVKSCQDAGIMVRMVTGDNLITAKNIAKACGIYQEGFGEVMEGPDFRKLSDDEYADVLPRLQVLARSSPTDKQILVQQLQRLGQVVAVTGDGTNDAPALRLADIGFSMGIAGTEVAKEASDVVLMDDNFASIVKAVLWGRNVFDSIRKFLQFQITVNIVGVLLAFISAVSSSEGESSLRPVQMLWINLIMDTLAALALATDEPTSDLLEREPNGRDAPLISREMWKQILGQSAYQLAVNITILYAGPSLLNIPSRSVVHDTIIFNSFVFQQLFNEFNCRRINGEMNIFKGVLRNKFFVSIMVFTFGMQIFMVELGGSFVGTTHLNTGQWFFCLGTGILSIPIGFILRIIPTRSWEHESTHRRTREYDVRLIEDPHLELMRPSSIGLSTPRSGSLALSPQQRARARMNWFSALTAISREQKLGKIYDLIHRQRRDRRKKVADPRLRWKKTISSVRTQQRVINAFKSGLHHEDDDSHARTTSNDQAHKRWERATHGAASQGKGKGKDKGKGRAQDVEPLIDV